MEINFRMNILFCQVFDAWRSFTALSKHRRSEENHRLDEVTTVLNQGKSQLFQRKRMKITLLCSVGLFSPFIEHELSRSSFCDRCVTGKMKRALVALAEHKNARKRKRSLIESAIAFNSNNVKRKIFSAWKEYQNLAFRKLVCFLSS